MKLIFCRACQDVVRLVSNKKRICECGKTGGKYIDDLNAIYFGNSAVPMGFANNSLIDAIFNQPNDGMGKTFNAFIIPKICPTYKFVKESEVND